MVKKECSTCGINDPHCCIPYINKRVNWGERKYINHCNCWQPKNSDEWIKEKLELEKLRMEQFGRVN